MRQPAESEALSRLFVRLQNAGEIVVLVGPPCCGKSTFARAVFPGYVRVSQAEGLGTRARCVEACSHALGEGKSVVIDNQNRDVETREDYLQVAKGRAAPIKVIVFGMSREFCLHLSSYRVLTQGSETLPTIAVNMFFSRFEAPRMSEGFQDIYHLTAEHFSPDWAKASVDLALLRSFLD